MRHRAPTVAVLGQGSIGRRHTGLLLDAGCDVIAHDPFAAAVVDGSRAAASSEEALDAAEAVVVATPTSEHLAQALAAVRAGCHALVEKPLSTSPEGVDELLAAAREGGRVLAVGFNLRFHPGPAQVRELVAGGAVGTPLRAEVTFGSWLPGWRPGTDYRTSYSARRELGGGVLLDAIHEIDYAVWALGDVAEASGWLARLSDLEMDVEDTALLTLRHRSGVLTTIGLDYLDRSYRRGCRIVGSEASLDWRWEAERIDLLTADGGCESRPAPSAVDHAYRAQTAAFLDAVRSGEITAGSALCDGAAGAHAVAVADAVVRSDAEGGRRVCL